MKQLSALSQSYLIGKFALTFAAGTVLFVRARIESNACFVFIPIVFFLAAVGGCVTAGKREFVESFPSFTTEVKVNQRPREGPPQLAEFDFSKSPGSVDLHINRQTWTETDVEKWTYADSKVYKAFSESGAKTWNLAPVLNVLYPLDVAIYLGRIENDKKDALAAFHSGSKVYHGRMTDWFVEPVGDPAREKLSTVHEKVGFANVAASPVEVEVLSSGDKFAGRTDGNGHAIVPLARSHEALVQLQAGDLKVSTLLDNSWTLAGACHLADTDLAKARNAQVVFGTGSTIPSSTSLISNPSINNHPQSLSSPSSEQSAQAAMSQQLQSLKDQLEALKKNQATQEELDRKQMQLDQKLHEVQVAKLNMPVATMPSPQPGAANRWALVIGLSKYKFQDASKGFSNLTFADSDAEAVKAALIAHGWREDHILSMINEQATKDEVEIALDSWLTKAGENDMILFFWSGHGFPDPVDPQKVYFVCYDTKVDVPATGYRMDRVVGSLTERQARNVVVLADTCHAGRLVTRGNDRGIGVDSYVRMIQETKSAPKGWIFMTGADADRNAIEHASWSHGAFTKCLLDALGPDGEPAVNHRAATMGDLKDHLSQEMPDITQRVLGKAQHPLITTNSGDDGIWNLDFDAPKTNH